MLRCSCCGVFYGGEDGEACPECGDSGYRVKATTIDYQQARIAALESSLRGLIKSLADFDDGQDNWDMVDGAIEAAEALLKEGE